MNLTYFLNDRYELLKLLYDNQLNIKGDIYISLSQQEIADIAHFSKLKTNKIINELKDLEFIVPYRNTRGKYSLTEKALNFIELIKITEI
ncbi:hypothetical protein FDA36_02655 [Clostridium botulinum]|nr:hypothetical protein [Clostridium botulinum]